jgi:hypothetical protein
MCKNNLHTLNRQNSTRSLICIRNKILHRTKYRQYEEHLTQQEFLFKDSIHQRIRFTGCVYNFREV